MWYFQKGIQRMRQMTEAWIEVNLILPVSYWFCGDHIGLLHKGLQVRIILSIQVYF